MLAHVGRHGTRRGAVGLEIVRQQRPAPPTRLDHIRPDLQAGRPVWLTQVPHMDAAGIIISFGRGAVKKDDDGWGGRRGQHHTARSGTVKRRWAGRCFCPLPPCVLPVVKGWPETGRRRHRRQLEGCAARCLFQAMKTRPVYPRRLFLARAGRGRFLRSCESRQEGGMRDCMSRQWHCGRCGSRTAS